ncbi:MAG: creatininase family protein [Actinobacteria bacterium]|nr:creatininase family protein [Chloroflexota bacterium]MBE3128676.1 creatininase family protein [Actinomycetota bacterium]
MKIRLEQLTSFEVEQLFQESNKKIGLLLPIGCLEQHGPYLPLGCDTDISRKASENLAKNLQKNDFYHALVMPDFTYTPSPGAENKAGTISVSFDFLGNGLIEIINAALETSWDFIVIINSHAHNQGRIIETSIAGSSGIFGKKIPIVVINLYEFINIANNIGLNAGSHAGEFEISLYHYYFKDYKFPDVFIKEKAIKKRPPKIYGLNIMERSFDGIISEELPDINRALTKSFEIGEKIDEEIYKDVINNLDIYFKYWH